MRGIKPFASNWSFPTRTSANIFDDFDRFFDTFVTPGLSQTTGYRLDCDVSQTKGHYLLSFDVPGVSKEDVKIKVANGALEISGERQSHKESTDENSVVRHERQYGKFQRVFTLPDLVDTDNIEAHYQDGVLEVILPKTETAADKSIEIQTGKEGFFSRLLGEKSKENAGDIKVS